jgi:hypothetical protein
MLFVILAIWFGYKKARDTGRNPYLWAAICGVSFIGVQLLVGLGAGVFVGLGIAFGGWNEGVYDQYSWLITIVAIVASFVTLFLLFKYLDRTPAEETAYEPPPPPTFNVDPEN